MDREADIPEVRQRPLAPARLNTQNRPAAVAQRLEQAKDFYHRILNLGWGSFIGIAVAGYTAFNLLFAWLYDALGGVANLHSFADGLFFSLGTMVTLNFGTMHPDTLATNIAVAVEALSGFLSFAILGALTFARLSKPTSRVLFAKSAVVARYQGVPTLMFRAANRRGNQIIQAEALVALVRREESDEGIEMRRIHDLPLIRARHPVFALSWTLMHPIDQSSPLHGHTLETMLDTDTFLIVVVSGIDDTFNQTIHARCLYRPEDIAWNHRFADILVPTPAGMATDFERFHDTVPLPTMAAHTKPSVA